MSLVFRVGVVVPCRNEAAVIERKLRNLARVAWPAHEERHRIIVVDDGSEDDTAKLAQQTLAYAFDPDGPIHVEVLPNAGSPGKAGAVATALGELAGVDLIVLTDADVVIADDALVELASAFADPRLAMACGAQCFVRELARDGTARGPEGGPLAAGAHIYDDVTAVVRRIESVFGRLFSVHGQLLAWRAAAAFAPTPGIAADDLELMMAARSSGGRVQLVPRAIFYEEKAQGDVHKKQALRRARAYFQVLRGRRSPLGKGLLSRLQWCFYRWGPAAAPTLPAFALFAIVVLANVLYGRVVATLALSFSVLWFLPVTRRLRRLLNTIQVARRIEREGPADALDDRWEMQRT